MAIEEPTEIVKKLVQEIGEIGLWIQAIGLVIILWIIFEIILLINNRVKRKQLYKIENKLQILEKKIDKLLKEK